MADLTVVKIDPRLFGLPAKLRVQHRQAKREIAREMLAEGNRQLQAARAVATATTQKLGEVQRLDDGFNAHWPTPADIIERGRRPGRKIPRWEDFRPILEVWARAVGFPLDKLYALAIKIQRDGIPGRYPFKKAVAVVTQFKLRSIVDRIFKV